MAEFRESKIVETTPYLGNGSNRVFATPTAYRSGTIRIFVNGVMYAADDDYFGWIESSATTIEMFIAPRVGDGIAAFYQEETSIFGGDDVKGTPFSPTDVC